MGQGMRSRPNTQSTSLELLTRRERDCLRLLLTGLGTPQVAGKLGISLSTLNQHLASARRKLAVTRTAQALLLYQRGSEAIRDGEANALPIVGGVVHETPFACDLAAALQRCGTFNEACSVLRAHAQELGVTLTLCGIVAEPPGQLTNGARVLDLSLPGDLSQQYAQMGGAGADPSVAYFVHNTRGALYDLGAVLMRNRDKLPKQVLLVGEALVDQKCRFMFHQPERDIATGAPLATTFMIAHQEVADFQRDARRQEALHVMSRVFWDVVQNKRWLRPVAGLTNRQREVLTFAARGFTGPETAEHMGISHRSVEKLLAAARKQLGARTTVSAVYRAMVYRAFP